MVRAQQPRQTAKVITSVSTDPVLAAYERLAEVTERMRGAADMADWDCLIELEAQCAALYEGLTQVETGASGDAAYQRRKSELICQVLDHDAHIRERVSGQLARIWHMIDGKPQVARLNAAYGAGGTVE